MTLRIATVTAGLLVLAASALSAAPPHASYTPDQAWRGRLDYYRSCAECHGGALEGVFGPALAGGDDNLKYQSVKDVYTYAAAHMPHGDPESLPEGEYVDIMAFLMQAHGIRAGSRELTKTTIDADAPATMGGK